MTNQCGGMNTITQEDFVSLPGKRKDSDIFDRHRAKSAAQANGSDDCHAKTPNFDERAFNRGIVRSRIEDIEDERRLLKSLEL